MHYISRNFERYSCSFVDSERQQTNLDKRHTTALFHCNDFTALFGLFFAQRQLQFVNATSSLTSKFVTFAQRKSVIELEAYCSLKLSAGHVSVDARGDWSGGVAIFGDDAISNDIEFNDSDNGFKQKQIRTQTAS